MFLRVCQAYEYLEQEENRRTYQTYIRIIEDKRIKMAEMDVKRKRYMEELNRREQEHQSTQA
jgi:hypothetical protein